MQEVIVRAWTVKDGPCYHTCGEAQMSLCTQQCAPWKKNPLNYKIQSLYRNFWHILPSSLLSEREREKEKEREKSYVLLWNANKSCQGSGRQVSGSLTWKIQSCPWGRGKGVTKADSLRRGANGSGGGQASSLQLVNFYRTEGLPRAGVSGNPRQIVFSH